MSARCTAKSRQTGNRCRNWPTVGMAVCRFHGGKTPRGTDAPAFRHGRYSKHAPTRLAARIDAALADPALMTLKDEAALVSAQIGEVLEVLDVGGLLARWREMAALVPVLRDAIAGEDQRRLVAVADALDACVTAAADERGRWGELVPLIDQKRKIVETQAKVDQRDTLSASEQGMLVALFVHALRCVRDVQDRQLALEALNQALTIPAPSRASA